MLTWRLNLITQERAKTIRTRKAFYLFLLQDNARQTEMVSCTSCGIAKLQRRSLHNISYVLWVERLKVYCTHRAAILRKRQLAKKNDHIGCKRICRKVPLIFFWKDEISCKKTGRRSCILFHYMNIICTSSTSATFSLNIGDQEIRKMSDNSSFENDTKIKREMCDKNIQLAIFHLLFLFVSSTDGDHQCHTVHICHWGIHMYICKTC